MAIWVRSRESNRVPTTGPPVASQPYRAGPSSRKLIDEEIQRILKAEVIEPTSSPLSAPIVLIPKPDGSVRFCVDYRRLNAVTENDSYALPRIDDCLDSFGEAQFFTTLDANSGYWQIEVSPRTETRQRLRPTADCIASSVCRLASRPHLQHSKELLMLFWRKYVSSPH